MHSLSVSVRSVIADAFSVVWEGLGLIDRCPNIIQAPGPFCDIPLHLGAGLGLLGIAPLVQQILTGETLRFPDGAPFQVFEEGGPELLGDGKFHTVNIRLLRDSTSPVNVTR